jgi:hypothetical protein
MLKHLPSVAGIRYAFVGKTMEQRASYRVLGTLLFTQLAITASLGAIDALANSLTPQTQQHGEGVYSNKEGHAVLLQVGPADGRMSLVSVLRTFV